MSLAQFYGSWQAAQDYPLNLVLETSNNGALEAKRDLLRSIAPELFNEDNELAVVEVKRQPAPGGEAQEPTVYSQCWPCC